MKDQTEAGCEKEAGSHGKEGGAFGNRFPFRRGGHVNHTPRAHSHPAPQLSCGQGKPPHRNELNLQKIILELLQGAIRKTWLKPLRPLKGKVVPYTLTHIRCQYKHVGHGTEWDKRGARGLCAAIYPLPSHHALLSLSQSPTPLLKCQRLHPLPCHALARLLRSAQKSKNPQEGPAAPFIQEGASCGPHHRLAKRRVLKGCVLGALATFTVTWLLLLQGKGLLVGTWGHKSTEFMNHKSLDTGLFYCIWKCNTLLIVTGGSRGAHRNTHRHRTHWQPAPPWHWRKLRGPWTQRTGNYTKNNCKLTYFLLVPKDSHVFMQAFPLLPSQGCRHLENSPQHKV